MPAGIELHIAPLALCTDNAVMGAIAIERLNAGLIEISISISRPAWCGADAAAQPQAHASSRHGNCTAALELPPRAARVPHRAAAAQAAATAEARAARRRAVARAAARPSRS